MCALVCELQVCACMVCARVCVCVHVCAWCGYARVCMVWVCTCVHVYAYLCAVCVCGYVHARVCNVCVHTCVYAHVSWVASLIREPSTLLLIFSRLKVCLSTSDRTSVEVRGQCAGICYFHCADPGIELRSSGLAVITLIS